MKDQKKKFQKKLREIYRKQNTIEPLIEGLEGKNRISSKTMNDYYIQLQTIVDGKGEKKPNNSENSTTKKQEIEIENIFDKLPCEKNSQATGIHKVLILGPAGMGKSTLMKYIAYKWGEEELWKDRFDYVYRVPLKILLSSDWQKGYNSKELDSFSLKCLIHYYLKSMLPKKERANFKIENVVWRDENNKKLNDRILLLLDGYDEVANFQDQFKEDLFEEVSEFENVILTSRPNAIDQKMAKNFDRSIKNKGLGSVGINQYFQRYFEEDKEKGKRLREYLDKNPTIREICNIPVNIAMLCFIWSEKSEAVDQISSLSDLYGQVVHRLGVRHRARQQSASTQDLGKLDGMIHNEHLQMDELKVLQHLAYQSLIGRELEDSCSEGFGGQKTRGKAETNNEASIQGSINSLELKNIFVSDVYKYGLLKAEKQSTGSFSFLHASFQEYLTARYLVEQLKSGASKKQGRVANFIVRHRNEPRLALILKFMAGILRTTPNQDGEAPASLQIFWDAILCNPSGALELGIDAKVNLLMHLLSQVKEKEIIDPRIPNGGMAEDFIDCRILENILWWVKDMKESDYISSNIKDGLLKILLNDDLSWSIDKSKDLNKKLSEKLQREPLEGKEILVLEQKKQSEEDRPADEKIIQEIGGAVSSLILKFSPDQQEKIIKKLLEDIRNEKNRKKNIHAIITIAQTAKLSLTNSRDFLEILLNLIFHEELGLASRIGIEETLKASEEPVSLKKSVKETLKKINFNFDSDVPEAKLKGIIEVTWIVGSDDVDFIREIVKIITPLLNSLELGQYKRAADILIELVDGCQKDISSQLIQDLIRIFLPKFNKNRMHFEMSAIQKLINSKTMKANNQLLNEIATKDLIPLLQERIYENYERDLSVVRALVLPLFEINQKKVEEIAKILIQNLENSNALEIVNFCSPLETIAQAYGKTNIQLIKKMVKSLIPTLQSPDWKVRMSALEFMKKIAQAGQDRKLCHKTIKALTPSLCDEKKELQAETLQYIIELFQTSKSPNLDLFQNIMSNLIKTFEDFDPSLRKASSKSLKDFVLKSGIPNLKWLKDVINTLMSLEKELVGVSKREIVLDTILDLAKIEVDGVQNVKFIKRLIEIFTSRMKNMSTDLKARMGAMVVRLKKIIKDRQDIQMVRDTFNGLICALSNSNDDVKLTSAKNMLGLFRILLQTDALLPRGTIEVFRPLLETKNATLRAAIIFYITEIFEITREKEIQFMKEIIPTLFIYIQELSSGSQPIQRSALLGLAKILEMAKNTEIQKTQSVMIALRNHQSSLEEKEFTASIQSLIRAYKNADNQILESILKFLIPLVSDDHVGKIVSEEIAALLIKGDSHLISSVEVSLNELLEGGNPYSKGWIFKLKWNLLIQENPIDIQHTDNYISILRPFLQNEISEIKQNAFAYITEAVKISQYQSDQLIQDLNQTLKEILSEEKGKQLQAAVPNNIVNFLSITANKDKELLKGVLEFFIGSPHSENEKGEKKSCSWVLKLLRTENDKAFLDQALKEVIPQLDLIQHSGLVQKLGVHVLQHIERIEECLDHENKDLRKNFRIGMLLYFRNYLNRFAVLEDIFKKDKKIDLIKKEVNESLLERVHDKDGCVIRTYDLSKFQTHSNDIAAFRSLLELEFDQAETRQCIEVFQVAFVVIAKVEYSQHEVEKHLPEVAWEVIILLLKHFKKDKLKWICENFDTLVKSASNPAVAKAIFGKLYHKILEARVINPEEEHLITLFIHLGLATSITKNGEITFQDVKYEIEGSDIRFMLEKIARIIIRMDHDLLGKQYETNTPLFERSYKNDDIKEAAVDKRKIVSVVDQRFVLRNDFWVLTCLKSLKAGSEIVLLEQRSAFGDHVVYKQGGGRQHFQEEPENFSLEAIFGKYQPDLTFNGRSKILSSKAGQELLKESFTTFQDIKCSQEYFGFYYHQELLNKGEGDRVKRILAQKQDNPLRAFENFLHGESVPEEKRGPLREYHEGFISTFSSVYLISINVNSSTFKVEEIEAEMSTSINLFKKLVSLIPYGIGDKISEGIVNALNYVERNKFSNNNKFMAELASDPVDLSDWVNEIARKRLDSDDKRQKIIDTKERNAETWIQEVKKIENAILSKIEQWKTELVQKTGVKNMFAKEIQKSLAFRLGQSDANQMIEAWFEFCPEVGEVEMSQDEKRKQFLQKTENNQNNQDNLNEMNDKINQENQDEIRNINNQDNLDDFNSLNNPIETKKSTDRKEVNRLNTSLEEFKVPNKGEGNCPECKIF